MAKKKITEVIKDETSNMFDKVDEKSTQIQEEITHEESVTEVIEIIEEKIQPTVEEIEIIDEIIEAAEEAKDKIIEAAEEVEEEIIEEAEEEIQDPKEDQSTDVEEISFNDISEDENDVTPEQKIVETIEENVKSELLEIILTILHRNHYYSYIVCGRHLNNYHNAKNIPDATLKAFYLEFISYGISSKDDADLMDAFKKYFNI